MSSKTHLINLRYQLSERREIQCYALAVELAFEPTMSRFGLYTGTLEKGSSPWGGFTVGRSSPSISTVVNLLGTYALFLWLYSLLPGGYVYLN